MSVNLTQYPISCQNVSTGNNAFWQDLSFVIGENLTLANFSFANSNNSSFVTDFFVAGFDDVERASFMSSNPGTEVNKVEYTVKYSVTSSPSDSPATSVMSAYITTSSGVFDAVPVIIGGTYYYGQGGTSDIGVKTATLTFDSTVNGTPSYNDLSSGAVTINLSFSVDNQSSVSVNIEIYEIKQVITLNSVVGPVMSVYTNDVHNQLVSNLSTIDLGTLFITEGTSAVLLSYKIKNTGSSDMTISSSVNSSLHIAVTNIPPSGQLIGPGKSYNISVQIFVPLAAIFLNEYFEINSNSSNSSTFKVYIKYEGVASLPSHHPIIKSYFGVSEITNNKTLSLSSFPLDISNIVSILFYNTGTSVLNISSFYLSGDATESAGSILDAGVSIVPGGSSLLKLSLNTTSYGNKVVNITVRTNDVQNNPFSFFLSYSVFPQYSPSISNDNIVLESDSNLDLGVIDKGKSFIKSYTLKNSGIYKTMIVNSIVAGSDLSLYGNYSFPYILLPNSANSLLFRIKFYTDSIGSKDGSFTIDYSEGTVP